jgi:uncharacterized protein YegP (UPF0339 family)
MAGKFELTKTKRGQFMFNLKASNGRIILTSEQYADKAGAKDGIASVKKRAGKDANFERKTSKKGEPFFVLKAANGEAIGSSEMYSSTSSMVAGIKSVMANAADAKVEDLTA